MRLNQPDNTLIFFDNERGCWWDDKCETDRCETDRFDFLDALLGSVDYEVMMMGDLDDD